MPEEFETFPEYVRKTADDGAGNLDDLADISARISDQFEQIGTVVTDFVDLPVDASVRLNGTFTSPDDAVKYLEGGGMLAYDENGAPISLPWVYFLKEFDENLQEDVWRVYIRNDSD